MHIDWIDDLLASYAQLPLLSAQLQGAPHPDGYRYTLLLHEAYIGAVLILRALDEAGRHHMTFARGFEDDIGRFHLSQTVTQTEHSFFLPFGVVPVNQDQSLQLEVSVIAIPPDGHAEVLGQGVFGCPWRGGDFNRMRYWQPLIGLCMTLARTNGPLTRERVSVVRQQLTQRLQPDRNEMQDLKALMKSEPSAEVSDLLDAHQIRAPDFDAGELFGILAKIAYADNDVSQAEVDLLHDIAFRLGADEARWEELRDYYNLTTRAEALKEHLTILELEADFTKRDIEKAFRAKIKVYHPDRYAKLPPEFQALAKELTQKINDARQALLDSLAPSKAGLLK